MKNDITVSLVAVAKSFGETKALKQCDFETRAGEVHAIVGENGSGKSTMAKIMSGVLVPDTGKVTILGETITSPTDAKRIGLITIFQEVLVAEESSVIDNLFVGRDGLFKKEGGSKATRVEAQTLLDRLIGKSIDLDRAVGEFPLSVKQWIVIARAILRKPRILILDESSAALDLDSTLRLHNEIDRLRATGATILIVTHRIAELIRIADRATILRDGVTVGRLEKHEINEANLLAMMTPSDRRTASLEEYGTQNSATPQATILTAKNVTVQRGGKSFDFDLPARSIVGIAGLDGQGQDAFVRALARIVSPFGAEFSVRSSQGELVGVETLEQARSNGIAYVSGDRKREGIFPQQSIYENLAIGTYKQHLGPLGIIRRSAIGPIFDREVDRLRIKIGSATDKITSLSGGNQQKVLIGRAFANRPQVIILNDPARGVDLGTKRDLYRELRSFTSQGGGVIYLSSEIEEFINFADRVDVFHAGTFFRSLAGEQIAEKPILAAMFGQTSGHITGFGSEGLTHHG